MYVFLARNGMFMLDACIFLAAVPLSFMIRLGFPLFLERHVPQAAAMALIAMIVKLSVFWMVGVYKVFWKYARFSDFRRIVISSCFSSVLLGLCLGIWLNLGSLPSIPSSIIGIDWLLSFLGVCLFRITTMIRFRRKYHVFS